MVIINANERDGVSHQVLDIGLHNQLPNEQK